ncbi:DUF2723 domain-containing protein, partial [candidate division CSSED10-310 bacterium]
MENLVFKHHYRMMLLPILILLILIFIYYSTLCPTVYWYDSAELTVVSDQIGIPHPTGYPTYLIMAKYFSLFTPSEPALGINAFSLLCSMLTLLCLIRYLKMLELAPSAISIGILFLAGSEVFWSQSIKAEVYTLNLLFIVLILLCEKVWLDTNDPRYACVSSFLFGLGMGNHVTLIFIGPALIWYRVRALYRHLKPVKQKQISLSFTFVSMNGLLFLLGLSVYLYLPLRAIFDPTINIGDPDNLEDFLQVIMGGQFYKYFLAHKPEQLWSQIVKPLKLGCPGSRIVKPFFILLTQLSPGGVILGLTGLMISFFRRFSSLGILISLSGFTALFVMFYRVQDIDCFSLPLIMTFSIWCSFGIHWFVSTWQMKQNKDIRLASQRNSNKLKLYAVHIVMFVLCLILMMKALFIRSLIDLSDYEATEHYIQSVYARVPREAYIFNKMTPEDWRLMAPLWYSKYCLLKRMDLKLYDDLGFRKLQRINPGEPIFVLHDDLTLRGRFRLIPQGPVWKVELKSLAFPTAVTPEQTIMLDMGPYNNADYRHDPFNPNPEIGSDHFFPHLIPGVLRWHQIPFAILLPYQESLIPSVLTTCFQQSFNMMIPLNELPTRSLWFLLDGGIQKHERVLCASIEVELQNGGVVRKNIYSFDDVWEYFNYKN